MTCIVERVGGDDRYPDAVAQVINAGGALAVYGAMTEADQLKAFRPTLALYASGSWTKVTYTEEEA